MKEIYRGEEEREEFYLLCCSNLFLQQPFPTVAGPTGFAKQAFRFSFCIIMIKQIPREGGELFQQS